MAEKPKPIEPRIPSASRSLEGALAPPVTGVPEAPELRSVKVIRAGAMVVAVLWEE